MKFVAKSASDKTDDWPFWMVVNDNGLNVTAALLPELWGRMPFLSRPAAEELARLATEDGRKVQYYFFVKDGEGFFYPVDNEAVAAFHRERNAKWLLEVA